MQVFRTLDELRESFYDSDKYLSIYRVVASIVSHYKLYHNNDGIDFDSTQLIPMIGGNILICESKNDLSIVQDYLIQSSKPRGLPVASLLPEKDYYSMYDGDGDIYFIPKKLCIDSQFIRDCIGMSLDTSLSDYFWNDRDGF